ncbi:6-carboxyhexanoate--CoA ligase [Desulfuromonas carbonis]|uniref:6-carboxyhexanoate--CoA ligase n=1 Tax=Desulfuromonas sp. DDH964 TaxID=1823759 RepID=UPI00078DD780|nr:6-carboxyhexanoate--CoA ligase [Desulfuromonas sp. DDH964]AMV72755.1 6-carboxyhexanoate--CoA ligase [Desulfuromonas sp. DDH964]
MNPTLYSLRMHSTREGKHISGAERIVPAEELARAGRDLLQRALDHTRGAADELRLSAEALDPAKIRYGRLPQVRTLPVADYQAGRRLAVDLLIKAGVSRLAVDQALAALVAGPAPGGVSMRGAMLVDADSGARLEADPARGVRASRMDLTRSADRMLRRRLARVGLNNPHVREALVLAAKVLAAPGIVAELCWSDDPDYPAGYVATAVDGYLRLPHLKPLGEERGGRAFFWRSGTASLEETVTFLERQVLLIDQVGTIARPPAQES